MIETMANATDNMFSEVTTFFTAAEVNDVNNNSDVDSNNSGPSPRDIYEDYTLHKVTVFFATYYLYVILAIGIPGNLASIFTIMTMPTVSSSKRKDQLSRPVKTISLTSGRTRDVRQAHVAILAGADIWAIVLKMTYSEVSKEALQLTTPGCAIIMFLQQFFTTYVNWIVVAMTTERFVAVWFPLRVGRIYTRKKALCVLSIFAVLTASCYACFFWIFKEEHEPGYGYYCQPRSEFQDFINGTFYYWFEGIISSILPCGLVLVGNILIITNIRRAKRAHRHLTNSFDQGGRKARDQRQITIMLLVVSVAFLLLNLPNAVLYIVKRYWRPEYFTYEFAEMAFTFRFVHFLLDLNHAVNFFLYFLSMSTFRRRFLDAIQCRSPKRRPTGSMYRTSQTYVASSQPSEFSRSEITGRSVSNLHPLKMNSGCAESHHSLKSCCSVNHRLSTQTDNSSRITANSDV